MDAPVSAVGDDLEVQQRLIERITACWSTQALRVAAELGLPDLLHEEPADARQLAARCGCDVEALHRLLRALCTLEICLERSDGRFELAPGGALMRAMPDDISNGMRALAMWWGGPMWSTWEGLGYSVRTGKSARALHTGRSHYRFMDDSPGVAALFHQSMRALTRLIADDVARLALWSDVGTLVDLGGGHGELTLAIAAGQPHLQAIVLDRPDAQAGAQALFEARGLATRVRFVAGNFFIDVPAGADCYMLKSILHNWNDEDCRRILRGCARVAAPGARLLVVERVRGQSMEPRPHDRALARTDLNMLIGLGGRERSLAEFTALLEGAGFAVTRTSQTRHEFDVIEARRVYGTGGRGPCSRPAAVASG